MIIKIDFGGIIMNKDKHVLPDDTDSLADRVRREAKSQEKWHTSKTIYGPDNEPLLEVEIKRNRGK